MDLLNSPPPWSGDKVGEVPPVPSLSSRRESLRPGGRPIDMDDPTHPMSVAMRVQDSTQSTATMDSTVSGMSSATSGEEAHTNSSPGARLRALKAKDERRDLASERASLLTPLHSPRCLLSLDCRSNQHRPHGLLSKLPSNPSSPYLPRLGSSRTTVAKKVERRSPRLDGQVRWREEGRSRRRPGCDTSSSFDLSRVSSSSPLEQSLAFHRRRFDDGRRFQPQHRREGDLRSSSGSRIARTPSSRTPTLGEHLINAVSSSS
jgi:hypothetical protein